MVLAKCKKLSIRKIETPANLKIIRKIKFRKLKVRKTKFCWLVLKL